MASRIERPRFEDPDLQREIMHLREVDNYTNLLYLALEYGSLALVIAGTVLFAEYRASWGLARLWNIPMFGAAIVLVGAIQHRLAGLGHEASHYSFMKNKLLNDLIPDIFCMFPLMTTVHFYRLFHMAHHQYTNDPHRDPDLQNLGHGKRAGEFPMTRGRFVRVIYFAVFVAPIRFLKYQWAYFQVNTLGKGRNVYVDGEESPGPGASPVPRLATMLGIGYLVLFNAMTWVLTTMKQPGWLLPAGLVGFGIAAGVI
jgi:fatty acid desaturase